MKLYHVISQLDQQYTAEVEDIITSPLQIDPYTKLRTELVNRLAPSKEQGIHQFLTLKMGDRKPSQFLRHLRRLAPDVSEDFLRNIWPRCLPRNVQVVLAGQPKGELDAAVTTASYRPLQCRYWSSAPPTDSTSLLQRIDDLSTERNRSRSKDPSHSPRNRHPGKRSLCRDGTATRLSWYHRRYGAQA
jgi:hypothetical protein